MTFPDPESTTLPGYPVGGTLDEHVETLNTVIGVYRGYQAAVLEALRADPRLPAMSVTHRPAHDADTWFWSTLDAVSADPRLNKAHRDQATEALFSAHLSEPMAVVSPSTRSQRLTASLRAAVVAVLPLAKTVSAPTVVMAPHRYPDFARDKLGATASAPGGDDTAKILGAQRSITPWPGPDARSPLGHRRAGTVKFYELTAAALLDPEPGCGKTGSLQLERFHEAGTPQQGAVTADPGIAAAGTARPACVGTAPVPELGTGSAEPCPDLAAGPGM